MPKSFLQFGPNILLSILSCVLNLDKYILDFLDFFNVETM